MCALVLILAFGAALLIIGIIQDNLTTAIFGGVVLALVVWALLSHPKGDADSDYADDDGEA
ncbi:hypothetical protein [Streptomyces sp. NBC_00620]|uniref:hypothetical protein n=1 Tax=Streptomyces sp. NBC_00620 TaxID=2903666 RepID=UPI0022517668|nr:hypothetical protein [Streptomyces sp. NBC_00620]MCX4973797.1 hypothetical protein [Streptomyces sp. NBC_00620]